MAKILIARGQATIYVQKDGYTITQSLGEYVFPADDTGEDSLVRHSHLDRTGDVRGRGTHGLYHRCGG